MQGKLKSFTPNIQNGVHRSYQSHDKTQFTFIIVFEENGVDITGEGSSVQSTGSKNWMIGQMHEYNKIQNEHGIRFSQIKALEQTTPSSQYVPIKEKASSIERESFIISEVAHKMALDLLNYLSSSDSDKVIEAIKIELSKYTEKEIQDITVDSTRRYVGKVSRELAHSIYKVAREIQESNAGGNKQTA